MDVLPACVYITRVPGVQGGQWRVKSPGTEMAVRRHVDAETQTCIPWKESVSAVPVCRGLLVYRKSHARGLSVMLRIFLNISRLEQ